MKFLVDELPENPEECPFSGKFLKKDEEGKLVNAFCCKCINAPVGTEFECRIGAYDFDCSMLRKFKAEAFRYQYGPGGSVVGETKLPIYLK